ncbi:MAG: hypothetical protein DMF15_10905 [Verrucomicrobia bacterium]|nr:MAG: hypothetical protein DMF15_10905 [Verrucomicrobiota bacterium]
MDHERLLHSNARSSGTVDQGGQTRSRCPDYGPGRKQRSPLTKSAGRGAYGKLLEGGVRIFEYQPTMIHIKSIVTDTLFSMIGSSNLDPRSAEVNEELDVVVYDRDFGRQMEETFTQDLRQSREYTLEQFRRRSLWERTVEWLAYPFRSQL